MSDSPVTELVIANPPKSHFTEAQRKYYYGVVAAAVPFLAVFSTQVEGTGSLILGLAAAVLGLTAGATAASNTVPLPKA